MAKGGVCNNVTVDLTETVEEIKADLRRELRKEMTAKVPKGDLRQIAAKTNSVVVPRDQACPVGLSEQEVPFDELTPTLQNFVKETGMDAPVKQCARMGGLGMIKFVDPAKFDGTHFALGLLTLPNVFSFATRLAEHNVIFPRVNRAVGSGALAGVTLVAHLLTGGRPFLLGAMVGQLPNFFDALAVEAIGALGMAPAPAVLPGQATNRGIGATPEEQELMNLRTELEKLGAVDSAEGSSEIPREGLRGRVMVVN